MQNRTSNICQQCEVLNQMCLQLLYNMSKSANLAVCYKLKIQVARFYIEVSGDFCEQRMKSFIQKIRKYFLTSRMIQFGKYGFTISLLNEQMK